MHIKAEEQPRGNIPWDGCSQVMHLYSFEFPYIILASQVEVDENAAKNSSTTRGIRRSLRILPLVWREGKEWCQGKIEN